MTYEKALEQLVDEHMKGYDRIMAEADREGRGGLDGPHCIKLKALESETFRKRDELKRKYGQ